MKGVDVSIFNDYVDWQTLKDNGIDLCHLQNRFWTKRH